MLDSAGIGALPDAHFSGDEDGNTLGNIADTVGGLELFHLEMLGLGKKGR